MILSLQMFHTDGESTMTIRQAMITVAAALLGALTMGAQVRCSQAGAHPPFVATDATPKAFQMVGASTEEFTGDAGVFGMTLACQADFAASRMCITEEALNTVAVPSGLTAAAWIRPSFVPPAGDALQRQGRDASGATGTTDQNITMTCRAWSDEFANNNFQGLTITPSGSIVPMTCEIARPVACCSLIPIPEPAQ